MTKESESSLIKTNPDLLAEARKLAGTTSGPQDRVSYVKVSYDDDIAPRGNFIFRRWNKEAELYEDEDLGSSLAAVVLAHTKQTNQWDHDAGSNIYVSNEFDDYAELIYLASDKRLIDKGTYRQLKDKYEGLRLQVVLYLQVNGQIAKMFLKGSSIVGFSDYEEISFKNSTIQQNQTIFTTTKEKNGAVEYFKLHFEKSEPQDLKEMIKLSREIRNGIILFQEKFLADRSEEDPIQEVLPSSESEEEESDMPENLLF